MTKSDYSDITLLQHILDAIADIASHQHPSIPHVTALRATIYELIVIGEAVGSLSEGLKERFSEVPWQKIKDSRNKMVHDYVDISEKIVADIVYNRLPLLKTQIEHILAELEN